MRLDLVPTPLRSRSQAAVALSLLSVATGSFLAPAPRAAPARARHVARCTLPATSSPGADQYRRRCRESPSALFSRELGRAPSEKADAYPGDSGTAAPWIFRILHIESVGLIDKVEGLKPAHALDTAWHWVESRKPLAEWGLIELLKQQFLLAENRNLTGAISPSIQPFLEGVRTELGSPQLPQLVNPNLDVGLAVLMPQIRAQIRLGFRSKPLTVFRLAYRTALLVAFSWLNRGLQLLPAGTARPTKWLPRLLQHVSTTLETNLGATDGSFSKVAMPELSKTRKTWRWWTQYDDAGYDPPRAPRTRRPPRYFNDLARDPRPAYADAWRVDLEGPEAWAPAAPLPAAAEPSDYYREYQKARFGRDARPSFERAWRVIEAS